MSVVGTTVLSPSTTWLVPQDTRGFNDGQRSMAEYRSALTGDATGGAMFQTLQVDQNQVRNVGVRLHSFEVKEDISGGLSGRGLQALYTVQFGSGSQMQWFIYGRWVTNEGVGLADVVLIDYAHPIFALVLDNITLARLQVSNQNVNGAAVDIHAHWAFYDTRRGV